MLSESLFISWPCLGAYGVLVPSPGLELTSPALEVWSLNYWTTQEVPSPIIFLQQHIYLLSHQSRTARTLLVQGILMIRAGCSGLWVNVNLKPPPGCRRMKALIHQQSQLGAQDRTVRLSAQPTQTGNCTPWVSSSRISTQRLVL